GNSAEDGGGAQGRPQGVVQGARPVSGEQAGREAAAPVQAWSPYAQLILAAWLLVSPSTLGYADQPAAWRDWASGAALAVLALAILRSPWPVAAQWATGLVGAWL